MANLFQNRRKFGLVLGALAGLLLVWVAGSSALPRENTSLRTETEGFKNLETAVGEAIKAQNSHYAEGEMAAEGHMILGTEVKDDVVKVYTLASVGNFGFENGILTKVSGSGAIPTVLTFRRNGVGNYTLVTYKEAEDGAYYTPSIKEMFPRKLQAKALSAHNYYPTLAQQQQTQAEAYLNSIGRKAEVNVDHVEKQLLDIDVQASNKLFAELTKDDQFLNTCPYWIGTKEQLENGVRYIYETSQNKTDDGHDLVIFQKKTPDGTIVQEAKYKITGPQPQLIDSPTPKKA